MVEPRKTGVLTSPAKRSGWRPADTSKVLSPIWDFGLWREVLVMALL